LEEKVGPLISDASARKEFDKKLKNIKNRMENDDKLLSKLSKGEKKSINEDTASALDWLKENPSATQKEVEKKQAKFDEKITPLFDRIDSLNEAEEIANKIKKRLQEPDDCLYKDLGKNDKKMIEKETNAILDWLGENPNASKQKIDQKREQYEEKVNPVIQKVEAKSSVQDLIKEYEDKLKKMINL